MQCHRCGETVTKAKHDTVVWGNQTRHSYRFTCSKKHRNEVEKDDDGNVVSVFVVGDEEEDV